MRPKIKIDKHFDLSKIKFDLSKQINMFAGSVIRDHKKRLRYGQGVDEKQMKKLSPSTIHAKRFNNASKPRVPLYGEGKMLNVYSKQRATKSRPINIIIPPKSRKEVASYHQSGTGSYTIKAKNAKVLGPLFNSRGQKYFAKEVKHPGLPKREWFGITKKQEIKGLKLINKTIARMIKNA
jgi:hypothetical protein